MMKNNIIVQGFDVMANKDINKAIELANKYNNAEVNTCHLAMALLRNRELAKSFTEKTGLDTAEFIENYLETKLIGMCYSEILDGCIGLNNSTESFHAVLSDTVRISAQYSKVSTREDLFRVLMSTPDTEFYDLLIEAGISTEKLEGIEDSLNEMAFLSSVATDLNVLAAGNKIDPIESRDDIVNQVIEVLGRRQKGNPCLIGEAGVGKTAIIEGLSQRINEGTVPKYLKDKHILNVDISAIVAGCKFRGDFEEKFGKIIDTATKSENIILFFDEFHSLIGAGSGADSGVSASNILKPALARGGLRIIGATTTKEYKKYVENDTAFERRLQPITVGEPSVKEAIRMVAKLAPVYSKYHNAVITEDVIESAVKLSDKYIANKKLPDKAITIIDETAARLKAINDDKKFVIAVADIKNTLSKLTGIDISDMDKSDKDRLVNLGTRLKEHLIGQDEAVMEVSRAIKRNRAGIRNETKPIGSFLFVGPTGVGKTELCKSLAREMFGSERDIIRIDMSEFMEKHSVSRLIGAPPGYVGFDDGGQLTDMVKRKPYSIVLLDEIEKAHPDVFNVFLQIMDDGRLTDNKGVTTDFKNTIIIMTSNAGYGAEVNKKNSIGFCAKQNDDKVEDKNAMKALETTFRPEFLNRLDKVVVFNKLEKEDIARIVRIMLVEVAKNLNEQGMSIKFSEPLVNYICEEGFSDKYGARNIRRKIQDLVEDYLADLVLTDEIATGSDIVVGIKDGKVTHKVNTLENRYCY